MSESMKDSLAELLVFAGVAVAVLLLASPLVSQVEYGQGLAVATVGERQIVELDDAGIMRFELGPTPKPGPCGAPRLRLTKGLSSIHVCGADGVWLRIAARKSW